GIGIRERVGQVAARRDRIRGVGLGDGEDRGGGHGGGDGSTADRTGLVGVDGVGAVGDGGAVGERTGDAHDQLDGAGGAGGEVAHRPGDDTGGEDAAGGGGDEGGVGRYGVGDHATCGLFPSATLFRSRVGQVAARRDRIRGVGL